MSSVFAKKNYTVLAAIAITLAIILSVGVPVFTGNSIVFAGNQQPSDSLFSGWENEQCKRTAYEVGVVVDSIAVDNIKYRGPDNNFYGLGCANGVFAFNNEFFEMQDKKVGRDFLSDNERCERLWSSRQASGDMKMNCEVDGGIATISTNVGEVYHGSQSCYPQSGPAPKQWSIDLPDGKQTEVFQLHHVCFDLIVKTETDVIDYTTQWQCKTFLAICSGFWKTVDDRTDFPVAQTAFDMNDVEKVVQGPYLPDFGETASLSWNRHWEQAVAKNNAPPCILLGYDRGRNFCSGEAFYGKVYLKLDIEPFTVEDANGDPLFRIRSGILSSYVAQDGLEAGYELGENIEALIAACKNDPDAICDYGTFDTTLVGGAKLNTRTGDQGIFRSQCPYNVGEKPEQSCGIVNINDAPSEIIMEFPVEMLAGMFHTEQTGIAGRSVHLDDFVALNAYQRFTVRVDIISSGIVILADEPPVPEPPVCEDCPPPPPGICADRIDCLIQWIEDNVILAIGIWFVFLLVILGFRVLRRAPTPASVIMA